MLFSLRFLMGSFRLCWLMCERPQSWFLSKAENHLKILDSIRTKGWLCLEQAFKSLPSVSTRGHRTKHTISPQTSPCWKQDILTFTAELCQLVCCYTYISCVCPRPESEQGDSSLPCSLMTWVEGESCVISCFFMTSIKEASHGWVLSSLYQSFVQSSSAFVLSFPLNRSNKFYWHIHVPLINLYLKINPGFPLTAEASVLYNAA